MFNDCIIMAGGSGTRLWPASNAEKPKQFLPITRGGLGGDTFFNAALKRALRVIDTEGDGRVIIIAGAAHVPHILRACAEFSAEEQGRCVLIPEPMAKNTAAAIACGISYIDRVSGTKRNILVLTSDHLISPLEVFKRDAAGAAVFAQQDKLVVFGIPPQRPETGYGYIEALEPLLLPPTHVLDHPEHTPRVFKVASFREKPDRKTAEQFMGSGHFYWNSGMFAFSSSYMLHTFRVHAPEVGIPFDMLGAPEERDYRVVQGLRVLSGWRNLQEAYAAAKPISFDYAIAEKCTETVMVAADFTWCDVGSWDEYAQLVGDTKAEVYRVGGESCFVDSDIPVALCGVEDLIVVVRSGKDGGMPSALIAKKGETQGVRDIVEQIKLAGKTKLL